MKTFQYLSVFLGTLCFVLLTSCEDVWWGDSDNREVIGTNYVDNVAVRSAKIHVSITYSIDFDDVYVLCGEQADLSDAKKYTEYEDVHYRSANYILNGLKPNTTYYYCSASHDGIGECRGTVKTFQTEPEVVTTLPASDVGSFFFRMRGVVDTSRLPEGCTYSCKFVYRENDNSTEYTTGLQENVESFGVRCWQRLPGTTTHYKAVLYVNGQLYAEGEELTVTLPACTPPEYVDLGLSVSWATCNVGAPSPENTGGYFYYGDTKGNATASVIDYGEISGTKYDIARVQWGAGWRIPTYVEAKELMDKCEWTKETFQGVNGFRVTGPNGNSIFLPMRGGVWDKKIYNYGSAAYYWMSYDYLADVDGGNNHSTTHIGCYEALDYSIVKECYYIESAETSKCAFPVRAVHD